MPGIEIEYPAALRGPQKVIDLDTGERVTPTQAIDFDGGQVLMLAINERCPIKDKDTGEWMAYWAAHRVKVEPLADSR